MSVNVSDTLVVEGTKIVLSWEAQDADHVESPMLGTLAPTGSMPVIVERSVHFTLTAINRYGPSASRSSEVVRVIPLPRIETIPIPRPPNLALTANIAVQAPPPIAPPRFELPRVPVRPPALPATPAPGSPAGGRAGRCCLRFPDLSSLASRLFRHSTFDTGGR